MIVVWGVFLPMALFNGEISETAADKYFGTKWLVAWNKGTVEANFGEDGHPWWYMDIATYMLVTNLILHLTPWAMTSINIWLSDVTILKADWKLQILHCLIYMFMNYIGNCYSKLIYPFIT